MELVASRISESVPLSPNDIPFVGTFRTMLYVYKRAPDAARLKETLRQLIREVPDLSGRLAQRQNEFVIVRNDAGVPFEVTDLDDPMPAYSVSNPIDADTNLDLRAYVEKPFSLEGALCAFRMTRYACGGAILAMEVSHALTDGYGRGWLLARWARLCRGAPLLPPLDLDRGKLIKIGTTCSSEAIAQRKFVNKPLAELIEKYSAKIDESTVYKVFSVSAHNLARFSAACRERVTLPWLSEQDVLTAKLWQAIATVATTETSGKFTTVQDFRRNSAIGVGEHYFGNAVTFASTDFCHEEVRSQPVEQLAARVRSAVSAALNKDKVSGELYAAWQNRGTTGSGLVAIPEEDIGSLENDLITVNNLSRFPVNELDFGTGTPCWVGGLKQPGPRTASIFPLSGESAGSGYAIHVNLVSTQMDAMAELVESDPFFQDL